MTDKQNFEKDINVPSKEIITHSCDAKDCEQYYPEHTCCHCRNAEWYRLRDELKRAEQECEELKKYLNEIRDEELSHLDIEWDEYQTCNRQADYSNIVTLVERALGEIND